MVLNISKSVSLNLLIAKHTDSNERHYYDYVTSGQLTSCRGFPFPLIDPLDFLVAVVSQPVVVHTLVSILHRLKTRLSMLRRMHHLLRVLHHSQTPLRIQPADNDPVCS